MTKKMVLFTELAKYYDLIYSVKNYKEEVNFLISLIDKYKKSSGDHLLDVACGTGRHLHEFKKHFHCLGVDMNEEMLAIARLHLPDIRFLQANMITMNLNTQVDILTCLFRSIGYIKTHAELAKVWETFALHLKPGGIVIVESALTKETNKTGTSFLMVYDSEDIKISRMNRMKIRDDFSVLDFHYLIADKDKDVQYIHDYHELLCVEPEIMLHFMRNAGLESHFLSLPEAKKPGVFIGVKPH